MAEIWILVIVISALLALLGLSIWIAIAIFAVALAGLQLFTVTPALQVLPRIMWGSTNSFVLVSLPLFIFMGELLLRTRVAEKMFDGLSAWLTFLPGRLLHTNVVASTIFAAVSGSSAATAATIGKINIHELSRRGYDEKVVVGSLAGAGTLGFLIPPSIVMIIYGVLAQVSIGQLFIAGVLPGVLLAAGFMLYLVAVALLRPSSIPSLVESYGWRDRASALLDLLPVSLLILAVLGAIYLGYATPTESAAVGVTGAFLLGAFYRSLSWEGIGQAVMGTVRTTSMIGLIIAAAAVLSSATGYLGLPRALSDWVTAQDLSPYALIAFLILVYVLLGLFLEGVSMIVITLPIVLPLVTAAGFESLWFGIFLVLMIEAAQITPPVGFNLYVLQGISGRPIQFVARGAFPFFLIILGVAIVITLWPQIVLFLPAQMVR